MKTFGIILVTVVILIMIAGMILCRCHEKKSFNGGVCPQCGGKLKLVDKDSQGGRCWICENRYNRYNSCRYHCWITYNVDK